MAKTANAAAGRKAAPKKAAKAAAPRLKDVFGQQSWTLATDEVEVSLSRRGGHLGPVTFFRGKTPFSPMPVPPWHKEKDVAKKHGSLLSVLRGDFFCMPFGNNDEAYGKEKYPSHGETAHNDWKLTGFGAATPDRGCGDCVHLTAVIDTKIRKARVGKTISLCKGENAVYVRHDISGMSGPMNYGHHAMLKWDKQGAGLISTSKFKYGQVLPIPFEKPEEGGYQCLKPGATFTSLDKVPMLDGSFADLSVYPARLGFEDLVMVCSDVKGPFAWSAAVYPERRMAWFSLKDPRKLASTVLWHSNRGRHYAPWSGRHVGVLGLEEVTSYFHLGIAQSVKPNPVSRKGIPTCRDFKPDETFSIPYIMVATPVPAGFDHVKSIDPVNGNKVRLTAKSGKKVEVRVGLEFLAFDA